jgi:hypothetical protein
MCNVLHETEKSLPLTVKNHTYHGELVLSFHNLTVIFELLIDFIFCKGRGMSISACLCL